MDARNKKLVILDPITQETYSLTLDEDDFNRAQEDVYFATYLLKSAKDSFNEENVAHCQQLSKPSTSAEHNQSGEGTCEVQPSSKHVWYYNEILCLIKSIESHYEDLQHPKKRKHVYENVVNNLISAGFSMNAANCQVKWKSLLRSYSIAKDHKNKSGRGPSRFQFFDEIDAFIGTKPSQKCNHALESDNVETLETASNVTENTSDISETVSETEETSNKKGKKRMRTNYEGFIMEKRKLEEQKSKRHEERMEVERLKLEIEKQKIELLKEYLKKK